VNLGMSIWVLIHPGRLGDVESTGRTIPAMCCVDRLKSQTKADIGTTVVF